MTGAQYDRTNLDKVNPCGVETIFRNPIVMSLKTDIKILHIIVNISRIFFSIKITDLYNKNGNWQVYKSLI